MAKAEIAVTIADLPAVQALIAHLRGRAEAAERALASLRANLGADGELREEIAEAIATAGGGYWARADAALETIRARTGRPLTQPDEIESGLCLGCLNGPLP